MSPEELTDVEMVALRDFLGEARLLIKQNHSPGGWNIGWNEGQAAGQTVFHLHIHVIPRYYGDVPDPRGGIRTILPGGNDLNNRK